LTTQTTEVNCSSQWWQRPLTRVANFKRTTNCSWFCTTLGRTVVAVWLPSRPSTSHPSFTCPSCALVLNLTLTHLPPAAQARHPTLSPLAAALHPKANSKDHIMEATIQETGKAFTIFYDMFRNISVIVQEGVAFGVDCPSGNLATLEPM